MISLFERTAQLIDIPSVSRDEAAMADLVEAELSLVPHLEVTRIEDNVIARTHFGREGRLLLGGHLDTVPPSGNERARIEGDKLFGRGSADMKGGIAVLLQLAASCESAGCDLSFVFYACEEIARSESGLEVVESADSNLLACDAAILLEPTSAQIEAGCQGVLRAEVVLGGVAGHSARPWTGRNAIHRLADLLGLVASFPVREPVIDQCTYRESLQAVRVEGGRAANVIPDEVRVVLSYRFAPDRNAETAFSAIGELLAPIMDQSLGDSIVMTESASAALPALEHPTLRELVRQSGKSPRAKLAWTDVARFGEKGIPAANFGPGDPELGHTANEWVPRSDLEDVFQVLAAVIESGF